MIDYLSSTQIKLIQNLKIREYRYLNKLFWAEGVRTVSELIENGTKLHFGIIDETNETLESVFAKKDKIFTCKSKDINKIKSTKSFSGIGGIFHFPEFKNFTQNTLIALNGINDPGNLGTIFRTALWFGYNEFLIDDISVDPYHEKTIRASMGAVSKINFNLISNLYDELLKYKNNGFLILSTDLKGKTFSKTKLHKKNIFVFGNEANGIVKNILKISDLIKIPKYGEGESLNVAVAFGILISKLHE